MRLPPEKIDEVRNATEIVDVIGGVVRLKKRGKNYLGLCPFHTEKTPSFTVSQEKQMFHCFGCGKGGNVFTFLMEIEKVSFVEAVRSLAEKAGVNLPSYSRDQDDTGDVQEELYNLCKLAARYYYKQMTETVEGKLAYEYFRHRGFTDETIKAFGLGYSPNGWDVFVKFAFAEGATTERLEQAGLARPRPDGSQYDYFRGRAMFPIFSSTGRVVGFGARKMREDDPVQGKYINSPETPIYNKSRILYGLFQSRDAIRELDAAILVEGYADLISLYQAGVKNVVASSGTALTPEQIEIIRRYTKNVTIVYDGDTAGSNAALRGVDLLLERDMDVRVAALPPGDDPDSFVKKHGGEAFLKMMAEAVSFIEYIALSFDRQGKLETPEGQAQTVRALVEAIAKIPDELKREFYIKHVAQKFKLYEVTLQRELEKQTRGFRRRGGEPERSLPDIGQSLAPGAAKSGMTGNGNAAPPVDIPPVERDILQTMLNGGLQIIQFVFEHVGLEQFHHPLTYAVAAHLLAIVEEGREYDASALMSELENDEQRLFVSNLTIEKYHFSKALAPTGEDNSYAIFVRQARDQILMLRRRVVEKLIEENTMLQREAIRRGEDVMPYLERHRDLNEQLQAILSTGSSA